MKSDIQNIVEHCFTHSESEKATVACPVSHTADSHGELEVELAVKRETTRVDVLLNAIRSSIDKKLITDSATVLEIGIGYGQVAFSIRQMYPKMDIHAIEHPGRYYLQSALFLNDLTKYNISLQLCDMLQQDIPLHDESMDLVVFCEVLEHLPPTSVHDVMEKICRVVKRDGIIIVASPNLTSFVNRVMFMSGRTPFEEAVEIDYAGGTYGHIRLYTIDEIRNICNRFHLRKLDGWHYSLPVYCRRWSVSAKITLLLEKIISIFVKATSSHWIAIMRKE